MLKMVPPTTLLCNYPSLKCRCRIWMAWTICSPGIFPLRLESKTRAPSTSVNIHKLHQPHQLNKSWYPSSKNPQFYILGYTWIHRLGTMDSSGWLSVPPWTEKVYVIWTSTFFQNRNQEGMFLMSEIFRCLIDNSNVDIDKSNILMFAIDPCHDGGIHCSPTFGRQPDVDSRTEKTPLIRLVVHINKYKLSKTRG